MANIRITDKQTVTPTASDFILINQAGNDKNTTLARVKTLLNGSVALETVEQNTNAAINEVNTKATNASTDINSIKSTIGIGNLETTSQNLIGATNEINTRVGRETLETVAQNCTGGINELNKKIGNIDVENDGTVATQLNANTQNITILQNNKASVVKGIWTPLLKGATGEATYTTQDGTYIKIDDVVICNFTLKISNVNTLTSFLCVQGLPFTPKKESVMSASNINGCKAGIGLSISGTLAIDGSCYLKKSTNADTYLPPLLATDIENNFEFSGLIIYRV